MDSIGSIQTVQYPGPMLDAAELGCTAGVKSSPMRQCCLAALLGQGSHLGSFELRVSWFRGLVFEVLVSSLPLCRTSDVGIVPILINSEL